MTLQLTINRKHFWSDLHEPMMKLVAIAAGMGDEVTFKTVGDDIVVSTTAAKARKSR